MTGSRTFETKTGQEPSDEELLALYALASKFGWQVRETTPVHQAGTPLLPDQLVASSAELFGDEIYGHNANNMLATLHESARGSATVVGGGIWWNLNPHSSSLRVYQLKSPESTVVQTAPQLERHVHHRLQESHPPFSVVTSLTPPDTAIGYVRPDRPTVWFEPGPITIEGIAAFAIARGYHQHRLHGAVGKTLRVIAHTAHVAVAPPQPSELDVPGAFLERAELSSIVRGSLLYNSARRVHEHIQKALEMQLYTGKPTAHGELLVEGRLQWVNTKKNGRELTYDRIARSSLAVVAANYSKQTAATELLYGLAAQAN